MAEIALEPTAERTAAASNAGSFICADRRENLKAISPHLRFGPEQALGSCHPNERATGRDVRQIIDSNEPNLRPRSSIGLIARQTAIIESGPIALGFVSAERRREKASRRVVLPSSRRRLLVSGFVVPPAQATDGLDCQPAGSRGQTCTADPTAGCRGSVEPATHERKQPDHPKPDHASSLPPRATASKSFDRPYAQVPTKQKAPRSRAFCEVELVGLEPTTSAMPWRRSPS